MDLKFCVYNVEWMKELFFTNNRPKTLQAAGVQSKKDALRSKQLAQIVKAIDPDILCVVEGPDTTVSGSKSTSKQLKNWCTLHGLTEYDAIEGLISGGQQELGAIYKKDKISLVHIPEKNKQKNPFNEPFYVDTEDSLIKEVYSHFRPPFELSIRKPDDNIELGRVIVAHTKSKGIFANVDLARYEQLSERNRKKLYAECYSIRERCEQWLDENPDQKIIVCGDINDGAGMDYYERRINKSAMEVLLGDVWEPEKIFKHILPKPKIGSKGWNPFSSKYKDTITKNTFRVLIDHILVSQNIPFTDPVIWNPDLSNVSQDVLDLRKELKEASDHFPVSVIISV